MPVNPYDDRKVTLRRPHGNGDLDIVWTSYTRRKANVTEALNLIYFFTKHTYAHFKFRLLLYGSHIFTIMQFAYFFSFSNEPSSASLVCSSLAHFPNNIDQGQTAPP